MATDPTTIPSVADLQETKQYMSNINEFVSSENNTLVDRDGKTRRTIAGINNQFDEMQSGELTAQAIEAADRAEIAADAVLANQPTGVIVFTTYALLGTYTPADATEQKASYKVTNDPDSSLNGYYHWVSGTSYEKDADLVVNTVDENNTSDAVSGSAVFAHTRDTINETVGIDRNNFIQCVSDNLVAGEGLNTDGTFTPSLSRIRTGYITLPSIRRYKFYQQDGLTTQSRTAWYDENYDFIALVFGQVEFVVPANAVYLVIEFDSRYWGNDLDAFKTAMNTTFFLGSIEEYAVRAAKGKAYIYAISETDNNDGVIADSMATSATLPVEVAIKINTPEILANTIFERATTNLIDANSILPNTGVNENGYHKTHTNQGTIDVSVTPGKNYSVSTALYMVSILWWLDGNGLPLSKSSLTVNADTLYTAPENARFARLVFNYSNVGDPALVTAMMVEGDTLPSSFVAFVDGYKLKKEYIPGAKGNKDWSSYKYVAIGDSRTAGYNSNISGNNDEGYQYTRAYPDVPAGGWSYPRDIEYNTDVVLDNRALSGAAFAYRSGITGIPTMYEQLSGFEGGAGIDADTDIVTVHGGTNDRVVTSNPTGNQVLMEDENDLYSHNTFKGSIRLFMKYFLLNYPDTVLVFLIDTKDATKDAAIEELATEYRFPVLKLYENSGTTQILDAEMQAADPEQQSYSADGIHESVRGQKMLGKHVAGEMAKYLW